MKKNYLISFNVTFHVSKVIYQFPDLISNYNQNTYFYQNKFFFFFIFDTKIFNIITFYKNKVTYQFPDVISNCSQNTYFYQNKLICHKV